MSYLLTSEQSEKLLKNLSSKWSISDKYLKCIYNFKDFNIAIEFINQVAPKCNEMNHHPKWINIYDTIEIELYTHDENGLTMKDFELSNYMDKIYEKLSLEHT